MIRAGKAAREVLHHKKGGGKSVEKEGNRKE